MAIAAAISTGSMKTVILALADLCRSAHGPAPMAYNPAGAAPSHVFSHGPFSEPSLAQMRNGLSFTLASAALLTSRCATEPLPESSSGDMHGRYASASAAALPPPLHERCTSTMGGVEGAPGTLPLGALLDAVAAQQARGAPPVRRASASFSGSRGPVAGLISNCVPAENQQLYSFMFLCICMLRLSCLDHSKRCYGRDSFGVA